MPTLGEVVALAKHKERRNELAEKVLKAKGLSLEEKKEIYYFLTLKPASPILLKSKRGRPSTSTRDMVFAHDLLSSRNTKKHKTIQILARKHNVSEESSAYYKALGRGIKELKILCKETISITKDKIDRCTDDHEINMLSMDVEWAEKVLSLIDLHEKKIAEKKTILN